jgi:hypothetical protein
MGRLLLRWVVCEADAFCNIALQAFYASLEECLFALVEVGKGVVCLLCAGGLFLSASNLIVGRDIRLARLERRRTRSQFP